MTEKSSERGGCAGGGPPPVLLRREPPAGTDAAGEATRRAAMERAALELSGEVGFERMTVAALVERSGSNLDRFYRTYADKADCYAVAYAAGMEELAAGALRACAGEPGWAGGMRAALAWLGELVEAEPTVVRGLLGETRAVDARTRANRMEVFERLSSAIDGARREAEMSGHTPPPLTAPFILGGIETSVLHFLDGPESGRFGEWLVGIVYVAVDLYLGPAAAREQVRLLGGPRS
jgi:AcrR family transcriptional regulator